VQSLSAASRLFAGSQGSDLFPNMRDGSEREYIKHVLLKNSIPGSSFLLFLFKYSQSDTFLLVLRSKEIQLLLDELHYWI
jgi:hypothetical protein